MWSRRRSSINGWAIRRLLYSSSRSSEKEPQGSRSDSMVMRLHLVWPNAKMPFTSGGQMTPEQYLALVTMHGSIMVFMVLTTAPQSGFGNFALPIQIGAADMAFPVLNMLSF